MKRGCEVFHNAINHASDAPFATFIESVGFSPPDRVQPGRFVHASCSCDTSGLPRADSTPIKPSVAGCLRDHHGSVPDSQGPPRSVLLQTLWVTVFEVFRHLARKLQGVHASDGAFRTIPILALVALARNLHPETDGFRSNRHFMLLRSGTRTPTTRTKELRWPLPKPRSM